MALKLPDASAELIVAGAEAVFFTRPSFDLVKIAAYMEAPEQTALEALRGAEMLRFLKKSGGSLYEPDENLLRLETHADSPGRRTLFRLRLEEFRAFQLFKERVLCGDSALESARKVKLLEEIDTDLPKIKDTFQQWGLYANSFQQDNTGRLVCSAEEGLIPAYILHLQSSLSSIDQTRTFVQNRLGEDIFRLLPVEAIDGITSALFRSQTKYEPKPEIGFSIGTAMEKILATIGAKAGPPVDFAGTKGMNQMAEKLKGAGVITGKHVGLIHAVGAFRNAADHDPDNEIGKTWTLTHEAILDVGLLTLDTVRSILNWTERNSATI